TSAGIGARDQYWPSACLCWRRGLSITSAIRSACRGARSRRHSVSLAADGAPGRTFLILLQGAPAWSAAAFLARRAPPGSIETLIAPTPGISFLAAKGREAADLDVWWGRMATAPGRTVVVAAHEDDLPRWIPGLDADFVIAVPDESAAALYEHLSNGKTT